MAAYDDLDVKRIFLVGIGSIVVTGVTALAVQVLYYNMADQQAVKTQAASDYRRQNEILTEQQNQISTYGVDGETGNITIPVNKAMELLVNENNKPQDEKTQNEKTLSTEKKNGRDET